MASQRRNAITHTESIIVTGVAAVAGVIAALSGAQPTGELVPDAVLTFGVAALVTWLAASAPWWALFVAAMLSVAGAIGGPVVWLVPAVAAVVVIGWIGARQVSEPVIRAAVAGVTVQVLLRMELDPFFLFSAIVAAVAMLLVIVAGLQRRPRYVRRRIIWSGVGLAVALVLAVVGMAASALPQRDNLTDGYRSLLDGLEFMQDGNAPAARRALFDASDQLADAGNAVGGVAAQPARFVPGVAQNRRAASDVLDRAADASRTAAEALGVVDLDRLRVVDGAIDVDAFADLLVPFEELEFTVLELRATLINSDSPWLVAPLSDRLDTSRSRIDQVATQSTALSAAARYAPAMLGADGPRRYLLAFVNPAESRAQSGLMGNWSELTADNGRLSVSRTGRTAELQSSLDGTDVFVSQPPEFFERLGAVGAGNPPEEGVGRNLWVNVASSPHMPTVGSVMAELYEVYAGYPIDGVFVIDPAGIASLISITGPIEIEGIPEPLTGRNAERFLVLDQYEFAESDREDILEAVTAATVDLVLSSTLPPPQELAREMSDAALHGHISGWAANSGEQQMFALVGMDAAFPALGGGANWSGDALAVVNDNANPNKIDSFLQRHVTYDVQIDETTGELTAALRIELTNTAPTSGLEPYVIGNRFDLPDGTNRSLLSVFTPHELSAYRYEGRTQNPIRHTERGWNVYQFMVEVPPAGGSVVVEAELASTIDPGRYELLLRPQPLPNADRLDLTVTDSDGDTVLRHVDPVVRRSVLSADGIRAWR